MINSNLKSDLEECGVKNGLQMPCEEYEKG